uniref:CSON012608 protein n=1 Tax=Culicoides sonorensis TaxID=179676 RepID=A0A336M8E1_CULSO
MKAKLVLLFCILALFEISLCAPPPCPAKTVPSTNNYALITKAYKGEHLKDGEDKYYSQPQSAYLEQLGKGHYVPVPHQKPQEYFSVPKGTVIVVPYKPENQTKPQDYLPKPQPCHQVVSSHHQYPPAFSYPIQLGNKKNEENKATLQAPIAATTPYSRAPVIADTENIRENKKINGMS